MIDEFMTARDWLGKYLTPQEQMDVVDRSGGASGIIYYTSFSEALWSCFKYLYEPLTEEEHNRWSEIANRVEHEIKSKKEDKLKAFVDSLDETEKIELKKMLENIK